jgi:hypothetical protein
MFLFQSACRSPDRRPTFNRRGSRMLTISTRKIETLEGKAVEVVINGTQTLLPDTGIAADVLSVIAPAIAAEVGPIKGWAPAKAAKKK